MTNTPKLKPNNILRGAMETAGYTHETMAKVIGLSFSAFNLKVNGKREFTLSECKRIAKKLNKTLDELFF